MHDPTHLVHLRLLLAVTTNLEVLAPLQQVTHGQVEGAACEAFLHCKGLQCMQAFSTQPIP